MNVLSVAYLGMKIPTLILAALMAQTPEGEVDKSDPATGSAKKYPESEVIASPSADAPSGRELLGRAVGRMGGGIDKMTSISFERESWHWRGDKLGYWEKAQTQARLEGQLAIRVDIPSEIDPKNGRPQNPVFVENGDDIFMMMNKSVKASEQNEMIARMVVRNELFAVLAPWVALRLSDEVRYEGRSKIETFEPSVIEEGKLPSNYAATTLEYDKVVASMPDGYQSACGNDVAFWLDPETAEVKRFSCRFDGREGVYGVYRVVCTIREWQQVGEVRLPAVISISAIGDAEIRELLFVSNIKIDPGVKEEDLRRP